MHPIYVCLIFGTSQNPSKPSPKCQRQVAQEWRNGIDDRYIAVSQDGQHDKDERLETRHFCDKMLADIYELYSYTPMYQWLSVYHGINPGPREQFGGSSKT